jgi:hypothetical protein
MGNKQEAAKQEEYVAHCAGCGRDLKEKEIEFSANMFWHFVWYHDWQTGSWGPLPCGPVMPIPGSKQKIKGKKDGDQERT